MISDSELLRYCSVPVLNRGRSIAFSRVEKMDELVCERTGDITRISTVVQASSTDVEAYHVSATLDERTGTLRSARCTCPAYAQARGGICKHVAALVLRFNRAPGQFAGYQERRFDGTSLALANYMRRSEARRLDAERARAEAASADLADGDRPAEPPAGSVHLDLTLAPSRAGWKARFKIAALGASYVVKDLASFVENMGAGAFCAYGKRLAFTHVPAVLDDVSRAAYELLVRAYAVRALSSEPVGGRLPAWAGASGEEARPYGSTWSAARVGERDLVLCDEETVELIDLYRPQGLSLDVDTPSGHLVVPARFVEGNPALDVALERYEDGGCAGYLVRRGSAAPRFIVGHEVTYALVVPTLYHCTSEFAACRDLVQMIFDAPDGELFVDDADRALFCRTILPALGDAVPAQVPAELEALRPVPCRLEFYLDRTDVGVTCDPVAVYGTRRYALLGGVAHGAPAAADLAARAGEDASCPTVAGIAEGVDAQADSRQAAQAVSPVELARDAVAERAGEDVVCAYFVTDERAGGTGHGTAAARGLDEGALGGVYGRGRGRHDGVGGEPSLRDGNSGGLHPTANSGCAVPLGAIMGPYLPAKDAAAMERLLAQGLPALRAAGALYTTPAFDGLVAPRPPKVRVGLSVKSGLIELSMIADEVPPSEVAAVLASYRRKKRFHRLADGTYLDLQGADLSELDGVASALGLTPAQLDAGVVELPGYHAFHLDAEVVDEDKDASFISYLDDFRDVDLLRYEVPPSLAGTLRPYQVDGYRWLRTVSERGFGGILADEMGLGKSVQLIAYLLATRDEARGVGPSLVVCPASLVYNWQAEFERFAPELRVGVVAGTPAERAAVLRGAHWVDDHATAPADSQELIGSDYEVLVTSYDLLRRDLASYKGRALFCQVLDEAQYIKNHTTKVAQAVKALSARHRFALTGTPIENRLSELWSIFDFLMPGIMGPYQRFQKRFEQPILDGDERAAASLQALTAPFVLRRLKRDVLRDLPEKIDGVVYVQLEGEQRRLYAAHEQRLRASLARTGDAEFKTGKLQILAELTRLRQLCCDPRLLYEDAPDASAKLAAIEDLVATCRDEGAKMLVFSQFTSFLDLIAARLRADGVPFYVITGSTPKRRRLELVDAFNADATPVFLISLKAGNTGLNLTGASVVVHADPWWNAAAQNQATDRAHRIGQTHVVSVYQVVARDTIEERIVRLQHAKSALADQFVSATSGTPTAGIAALTKDDLLELLG